MAKPIKETPVLTGSDALRFNADIKHVVKVSASDKARMKTNYEELLSKMINSQVD